MSRYVDIPAIVQVIGSLYNMPSLLENENYHFYEEDFTEEFHKVLFGSIYNLYQLGAKEIDIEAIEKYLETKPKSFAIYKTNKGAEYLQKVRETIHASTFAYYYNRMKKMTLLRMYNEKCGMDLSWLYDKDNILNAKKKQAQDEWLDNTSLETIAETIDKKITDIKLKYVDEADESATNAGEGALELLESFKTAPEIGVPLYGPIINTITRGARLKKFYLRSAATGVGKTRSMIADACYIGCKEYWNTKTKKWESTGEALPTIFITTEQEKSEIQTMIIAFLSAVDEEHILSAKYEDGEWERVTYAAELLSNSPLYIKELPDFSLKDIENTIKRGIRDFNVQYVFFDYIHTSMKILSEVTSKTGIKGLREDNVLFMISIRLKDLCNQYGIFILSATQLNSDYTTAQQYDQNLLRGAKAIADKIDCGLIMLEVSKEDVDALREVVEKTGLEMPTIKISVYKNRRGKYKSVLLWCKANRNICRIEPMFVTNYNYEVVKIDDMQIRVFSEE